MLLLNITRANEADPGQQHPLQAVLSRTSRTGVPNEPEYTNGTNKGTKLSERGSQDVIVVDFDGSSDPEAPHNFPKIRKIAMTVLAIWATMVTLSDGSLYTVAHEAIAEEFHINESVFPHTYWPITTWALGAATFALFLLPLMEEFGVYWGFIGSWVAMIAFIAPQATAHNFATIVVTRFFVGGFVAVIANSATSIIISLWPDHKTSSPIIGLWIVFYLVGNSIGPVIGAAIFQFLDWRWTFYMQIIYYAIMLPFYVIILKETRAEAILLSKARRLRKQGVPAFTKAELDPTSLGAYILKSARRPVVMLFTEPVVFANTVWSAFILGTIYLFTQSAEQIFVSLYNWTPVQASYVQGAVVIGELLGVVGVLANDYLYFRSASTNRETQVNLYQNHGCTQPFPAAYSVSLGVCLCMLGRLILPCHGSLQPSDSAWWDGVRF